MEKEKGRRFRWWTPKVRTILLLVVAILLMIALLFGTFYNRLLDRINLVDDRTSMTPKPPTTVSADTESTTEELSENTDPGDPDETEEETEPSTSETTEAGDLGDPIPISDEDLELLDEKIDEEQRKYFLKVKRNYLRSYPIPSGNVKNIMLIGIDSREEGDFGRSDAMMIASINKDKGQVTLTSLMRDVFVFIPGHGYERLGHANSLGGPQLLSETVEHNFKIPVDDYVVVDFNSMVDVVDELGGVKVEITEEERYQIRLMIKERNEALGLDEDEDYLEDAGEVKLNGIQALTYSRIRVIGTDFARTSRQRAVMEAIYAKMKRMNVAELYSFADKVLPMVTTNLSKPEITEVIMDASTTLDYKLVPCRIPIDGSFEDALIRKMAVLIIDFPKNIEALMDEIY